MNYIAIDIGSTYIKSALLHLDSYKMIEVNKIPTPGKLKHTDERKYEIEVERIVSTITTVIDRYTEKYKQIKGILLSTQMHGFVYRSQNSQDIYISWQDRRCLNKMNNKEESYLSHLEQLLSKEDMIPCGVYLKPGLGLCNLYTLLHSDHSIPKDGELFTLGSYIIYRLTGNNICHIMNAAPLGIANVVTRDWEQNIIKKAGLETITLPTIAKDDLQICGLYSTKGQDIPVYPDFGDQQIAILGSLASTNDVVINIATASQVSKTTDYFIPGEYEIRPYFEKKYLNTISNMPAGRNLDVLIQFIHQTVKEVTGIEIDREKIWKRISEGGFSESDGLEVDTDFYSIDGGRISGITAHNFNMKNLFKSAFESMATTYWNNMNILCKNDPYIHTLICAGGVVWNQPDLVDIIRKVTGRDITLPPNQDEVFSGMFRLALVCEGICENLEDKKEIVLKMEG